MATEWVLPGVSGLPLNRLPLLSTHELAQADRVTTRIGDRLAFSAHDAGADTKIELTGVELGRLRVFGVRHAIPTAVHSAPLRSHHIIVPLRGRLQAGSGSRPLDVGPGTGVVCPVGTRLDVRWSGRSIALVVTVARDEFDRVCANRPDGDFTVALLPVTPSLTSGPGRSFANVLACLCSECNVAGGNPAVISGLEDLVLAALVDLTRPAAISPPGVRSTARRRRGLQKALDHLREYPRQHPGVEELARIACLSRRSLETAFVEHLGTGPREYVTRERLHGARRELLAGASDTIGTLATRWGFDNPSRFARLYRRAFAELPSATRARASSRH